MSLLEALQRSYVKIPLAESTNSKLKKTINYNYDFELADRHRETEYRRRLEEALLRLIP